MNINLLSVNTVMVKQCLLLLKHDLEALEDFWMNKADIETMSIDDLYNNFKIVEQDVKKSVSASTDAQNMAFMTAPSTSSTNDVNTAKPTYEVSTVSPNVNTNSPQVSTAIFSDNVVYAFMVENPNGSNLLQQDLEQIHEDDLEVMDLKWQLSLLKCFNCHKMGHFARECRAPRNKDGHFRYQDNTRKQGNNEDTSSKAMLAIDGVGFDWSDMAEEQVQTNMALMAFLDSECDDLIVKLNQTEFKATTYKRGLTTVEEQLVTYRNNEFEKVKQEKEGIEFIIKKFDNASKSLDKLLGSQITDKSKKGLGYNVVPPPHHLIYNAPTKLDLSYSGLDEFKEPEFKSYGPRDSNLESNIDKKSDNSKENTDDSLVKEQVFKNENSSIVSPLNVDKETMPRAVNTARPYTTLVNAVRAKRGKPQLDDKGFVDSGCSRHMTGNIAYLSDFKEFDGGYVTFGGGTYGGRISGKGSLKTNCLDFKDVYFVNELKFNLFSVSQMWDKKNYVLFTDIECLVLSPNFKNINKLVKENLVRGLPTKHFENDQTCAACLNGKQHRASSTKDETSEILKNFIKEIENLVDKKVKIIRCDNGKEFKNTVMDDFCREKGIRRENSVARTPQQNGVAERRNMTLIEAPKTMLADSKLPTTFWAEAISTACYVQNMVLVVKPYNKTPYELFRGFKPALRFMRPFGCHVTILNTLDNLGKFDGKSDEVAAGTVSNISAGTSEVNSQECIVMPIWKDTSHFDSPTVNVDNDDSSSKDVNVVGQQVNTVSPDVNTGSPKLNDVGPSSTVQTRRMLKPTSEQGFLSDVYEQKTHDTLNTCLYACFLSQIEPTSIAKALSDSSWVEAMQEELLTSTSTSLEIGWIS
ncbi:putative ribonuclease H-like domain-containing protein [Tanacetum coccineum]